MPKLKTKQIAETTLTKVVTTISPIHRDESTLEDLILAGTSIIRVNLSHFKTHCDAADEEQAQEWAGHKQTWLEILQNLVRVRRRLGVAVAIMVDTCGPEFRVRLGSPEPIPVAQGERVDLRVVNYVGRAVSGTSEEGVRVVDVLGPEDFKGFGERSQEDSLVRIADGELTLKILEIQGGLVRTEAVNESQLEDGKSANFPGIAIHAAAVSKRDRLDLEYFVQLPDPDDAEKKIPIDFVAQSFVKSRVDVEDLKDYLKRLCPNENIGVVAKIETSEATRDTQTTESIIAAADSVMIARGDLANQSERYKVPQIQRNIIRLSHDARKPVIVATGVYRGLVKSSEPSRAEVENVRSALEWGVDAFMLSDETAPRKDASVVIRKIFEQIEYDEEKLTSPDHFKQRREEIREVFETNYRQFMHDKGRTTHPRLEQEFRRRDMAMAAADRVTNRRAGGVFMQSLTGQTTREMAHFLPHAPLYMIIQDPSVGRRHLLYRAVRPVVVDYEPGEERDLDMKSLIWQITEELEVCNGSEDFILATYGHPVTNTLFAVGGWERDTF